MEARIAVFRSPSAPFCRTDPLLVYYESFPEPACTLSFWTVDKMVPSSIASAAASLAVPRAKFQPTILSAQVALSAPIRLDLTAQTLAQAIVPSEVVAESALETALLLRQRRRHPHRRRLVQPQAEVPLVVYPVKMIPTDNSFVFCKIIRHPASLLSFRTAQRPQTMHCSVEGAPLSRRTTRQRRLTL